LPIAIPFALAGGLARPEFHPDTALSTGITFSVLPCPRGLRRPASGTEGHGVDRRFKVRAWRHASSDNRMSMHDRRGIVAAFDTANPVPDASETVMTARLNHNRSAACGRLARCTSGDETPRRYRALTR
jgi:hypothetical protein